MAAVLARVIVDGAVVGGVFFDNNVVVITAPLLAYMVGWDGHKVKAHVDEKGWKIERVNHKYRVVDDGKNGEK